MMRAAARRPGRLNCPGNGPLETVGPRPLVDKHFSVFDQVWWVCFLQGPAVPSASVYVEAVSRHDVPRRRARVDAVSFVALSTTAPATAIDFHG